jgi:ankyrin repeat protein
MHPLDRELVVHASCNDQLGIRMAHNRGADLRACDRFGNTAYHHACKHGHFQAAALLKSLGADDTTRNNDGLTGQDLLPD